jgi:hypothetical protein
VLHDPKYRRHIVADPTAAGTDWHGTEDARVMRMRCRHPSADSGISVVVPLAGNPFRDRPPDADELLKLRLVLATFKDGSGNLKMSDGSHRADWRQVERVFAEVLEGSTAESKAVFDVDVPPDDEARPYGLSIKTSLRKSDDRVLLELNNSPAKMLAHAVPLGFAKMVGKQAEWDCTDSEMGFSVLDAVKSWHEACRPTHDVDRSSYVVMTHDQPKNRFEVFWFDLDLGDAAKLVWTERGRALIGTDSGGVVRWEFYRGSGGQLKWYPDGNAAKWRSGVFELPDAAAMQTLTVRAEQMFPNVWPAAKPPLAAK